MRYSMWAYPWDLQDLGLETTYNDYRNQAGVNSISLAVSYHAGRFLQPRSPKRISYFPEDGTIYFKPNDDLWKNKEITPLVAKNLHEEGDMLRALIRDRQDHGLSVSCWTVCLHNTRLGMKHPEHVTRNAFGDPNYYSLCPSSPAVRDYATTLIADLTHSYIPDVVELETIGFMGFEHGYHHEKDGLGLQNEDEFLLSICFCDHCTASAKKQGIDASAAQKHVMELLNQSSARETPEAQFPDFPTKKLETFKALPELYQYLLWRREPVTSLVRSIKEAAHPGSKILMIEGENAWRDGIDIPKAVEACDGLIYCAYTSTPEEITEAVTSLKRQLGTQKYLGLGASLFYEQTPNKALLDSRVHAAVNAGSNGINYYNYGLIPESRLPWIRSSTMISFDLE